MSAARGRQAEEVFLGVMDQPPGEREAALDRLCAGDQTLRADVLSLLECHDRAGGFLDNAALLTHSLGGLARGLEPEQALRAGTRLGVYTIERLLGEGGMGAVYVARQERPKRTVALKVIRRGLGTSALVRRFEHEAEVLGRLHHPGIAQIFEAGAAAVLGEEARGPQPFIAMELIDGLPLTRHAEERGLDARGRMELLARVCDAVHHAHQRGVIHRDLKPANILVDESGQPKVLDFGVARAADADLRVTTMQTGVGQLIGTLPYMSPEQVLADPSEVDTRSDVYAMGVILYQLLTGRMPLDLSSRSIPEAARVIRDEAPARLSSVSRVFRGDVETIVSRAMEKDKARRYQSAAELAEDLRRFLRSEPIMAKQDSALYVLRTQLRRHRGIAAAAAAVLATLAAFAVYAGVQARVNRHRAERESGLKLAAEASRDEAIEAKGEAERERQRADSTNERLLVELHHSNIDRGRLMFASGNVAGAEDLIWREALENPTSKAARWALWELQANLPYHRTLPERGYGLGSLAYSPDGERLAVVGPDAGIDVWTGDLAKRVLSIGPLEGGVITLAFAPDGRRLYSGDGTGAVRVHDALKGGSGSLIHRHDRPVGRMRVSPDGRWLASATTSTVFLVSDTRGGGEARQFVGHTDRVFGLAFSPDSDTVASVARDGTVRLWEVATGQKGQAFTFEVRPTTIEFSSDGSSLYVGLQSNELRVLSLNGERPTGVIKTALERILSLSRSADGQSLLVGGYGGIEAWDPGTLTHRHSYLAADPLMYEVAWRPGRPEFASISSQGVVRVWESTVRPHERRGEAASWVLCGALSPRGGEFLAGTSQGELALWDAAACAKKRTITKFPSPMRALQYSADGLYAAAAWRGGAVGVWRTADWSEVCGFYVTEGDVFNLALNPDGTRLAVVDQTGVIRLFDARSGAPLRQLKTEGGPIMNLAFDPTGRRLATVGGTPSIVVWDHEAGTRLASHAGDVMTWTCAFSPDGRTLATPGTARSIELRDAETLTVRAAMRGHVDQILRLAFNHDGSLLASCGADGDVRMWDPASARTLAVVRRARTQVTALSFSTDDSWLLTGGQDGGVVVTDLRYYLRHITGNAEFNVNRQRMIAEREFDPGPLLEWAGSTERGGQTPP